MKTLARSLIPLTVAILLTGCMGHDGAATGAPSRNDFPAAPQQPESAPKPGEELFAMAVQARDRETAWYWLCLAAMRGHAVAQNAVGDRYRQGRDPVEQDRVVAYLWYSAALRNGLTAAGIMRDELVTKMHDADIQSAKQRLEQWAPGGCQAAPS